MLTLVKRLFTNKDIDKDYNNDDKLNLISDYKLIISNLKLTKLDSTKKAEIENLERLILELEN